MFPLATVAIAFICRSAVGFAPSSLTSRVSAFHSSETTSFHTSSLAVATTRLLATKYGSDFQYNEEEHMAVPPFDPFDCGEYTNWDMMSPSADQHRITSDKSTINSLHYLVAPLSIIVPTAAANAADGLSTGLYNPDSFKPVCSASDGFYRFLQGSTRAVVGDENFSEYGPLIAGGLLRIRLELCVVESFFNEAVGPFIKENGLSWILPLHETVETFLAGTIFALATTFILVGSTKLIQIIAFYGDLIIGGPCRLFGGFFFDRARGEPVTLDVSFFGFFKTRLVGPPIDFKEEGNKKTLGDVDKSLIDFEKVKPTDVPLLAVSGGVKVVGETSKLFREFIEALDLFVGRYLVLIASGYIILKFVHFKIFPDFP